MTDQKMKHQVFDDLKPLISEVIELFEAFQEERLGKVEADLKNCLSEIGFCLGKTSEQLPLSGRAYFDAFLEEELSIQDRLAALEQVLNLIDFKLEDPSFSDFSQSENLKRWIRFFHNSKEKKTSFHDVLLEGMGASSGRATGRVFVIQSNQDYLNIPDNSIVVAKATRPDLIIGIEKVNAIITDIGGKLCHASIIARQMGLPCVVNCMTATEVLEDGMWVTVDGDQGLISKARKNIHFC